MEEEKAYEIFTDASFDDITKVGTYAIVIMQEQKTLKTIAKRCNIQLENSTECEIFAIYQAINVILSCYWKKDKIQKFWVSTDCSVARDFFIDNNNTIKIFEENLEMSTLMRKIYKKLCNKLSKKGCSFRLKWIPRETNKIAHKYAYTTFQKLKTVNYKNEILVIDKRSFLELLTKFNKKQCKIIQYLFNISNEQKLIVMTQKQIAISLNLPVSTINNIFQELVRLNILEKVKNGRYALLI